MQVVHPSNWLVFEANDNVVLADTCLMRRTVGLHAQHQQSCTLQVVVANELAMQRDILAGNPQIPTADLSITDETSGNEAGGLSPNSKANSLSAHDHCRIYANDFAARIH